MRGNDFLDKIGLIDFAYVEAADMCCAHKGRTKKHNSARLAALAACLCLTAVGALCLSVYLRSASPGRRPLPPANDNPGHTDIQNTLPNSDGADSSLGASQDLQSADSSLNPSQNLQSDNASSDTYRNLEELLAYLSGHDYHSRTLDASGGGADVRADNAVEPGKSAGYRGFVYEIDAQTHRVAIYDENAQPVGEISSPAAHLFLFGERLILVGETQTGGTEIDMEMSAFAEIYDLTVPERPTLTDRFLQLGSLSACFMKDGSLYLLSSDGVCACGYSRLDEVSDYMPKLQHNSGSGSYAALTWTDREINILGEPASVRYTAVARIDVNSGTVLDKHACYGNIEKIFYGGDYIAFLTYAHTETLYTLPALYFFRTDGLFYETKLETADALGLDRSVNIENDSLPDGVYPSVDSVSLEGGVCRAIGTLLRQKGNSYSMELMSIYFNPADGSAVHEELSFPDMETGTFFLDDVLWEESRAIVSVSRFTEQDGDFRTYTQLVFVTFGDDGPAFHVGDFTCDRVTGVDKMYGYGNPLGHIHPFISLGGGIYLRYNGAPDGFDIYDFSDSSSPLCLYRSDGETGDGGRFEFENYAYDRTTFGVLKITPDENGEYRNVTYTWQIYSVNPSAAQPFTLLGEYPAAGIDRTLCIP